MQRLARRLPAWVEKTHDINLDLLEPISSYLQSMFHVFTFRNLGPHKLWGILRRIFGGQTSNWGGHLLTNLCSSPLSGLQVNWTWFPQIKQGFFGPPIARIPVELVLNIYLFRLQCSRMCVKFSKYLRVIPCVWKVRFRLSVVNLCDANSWY